MNGIRTTVQQIARRTYMYTDRNTRHSKRHFLVFRGTKNMQVCQNLAIDCFHDHNTFTYTWTTYRPVRNKSSSQSKAVEVRFSSALFYHLIVLLVVSLFTYCSLDIYNILLQLGLDSLWDQRPDRLRG
jgi:hypothetical protein